MIIILLVVAFLGLPAGWILASLIHHRNMMKSVGGHQYHYWPDGCQWKS